MIFLLEVRLETAAPRQKELEAIEKKIVESVINPVGRSEKQI